MKPATFDAFEQASRSAGYDEILERVWEPNKVIPTHTHPFDVTAVITQGDMLLTVGDLKRHLRPGDTFDVAAGVPHAEHYGEQGTSLWVARRHAGSPAH